MADDRPKVLNVYMNEKMEFFWDKHLHQPVTQPLYQKKGEPVLYGDQAFSQRLHTILVQSAPVPNIAVGASSVADPSGQRASTACNITARPCSVADPSGQRASTACNITARPCSVLDLSGWCASTVPDITVRATSTTASSISAGQSCRSEPPTTLRQHDVFTTQQTLFLIDLMREHLLNDHSDLPRSLADLCDKVKKSRGHRKAFWEEMSKRMTEQFKVQFERERVARKWGTMIDAFKKVKDNNNSTGQGTMKFQFFKEMNELIGYQHDIDFPVIGTQQGVQVVRPQALTKPAQNSQTENRSAMSLRKRKGQGGELLEFLQDAEAANERRHNGMLEYRQKSQASFERLMQGLIEKE